MTTLIMYIIVMSAGRVVMSSIEKPNAVMYGMPTYNRVCCEEYRRVMRVTDIHVNHVVERLLVGIHH